jgi:hypothetical protein
MRTAIMLTAVAVLATSFDRFVTTPSSDVAAGTALAQNAGPLPTAAVNPGLGAPPPGGHLGDAPAGAAGGAGRVSGGVVAPADPAARLGTLNENRLPAPATGALPNAVGAVPPAAAGAVAPPAAGAVGVPPTGAVTAPAPPAVR